MSFRAFALLGLFAFGLAGCASSAASPTPAPTSTPPPACYPPVPAITQAYPLSGSSGISSAVGLIVFQAASSLNLSSWQVQLLPGTASPTILGSALGGPPSPLPSPIAPLVAGNAYFGASLPPLNAATQYQVQVFMPGLACLAPLPTGMFTTQ